jgi:hypothetical protein
MTKSWISFEGLQHRAKYPARERNWPERCNRDFKRYTAILLKP